MRTCLLPALTLLMCILAPPMLVARTIAFETTEVTSPDIALSPDGKTLIFTLLGHLFRLPVEGGTAEQLTFGPSYDSEPVFSPDGGRVAFVSDRDGSVGNIFVLELSGGEVTRLTHNRWAERPAWSPDGRTIAFLSFQKDGPISMFASLSYSSLPALVNRVSATGGSVEIVSEDAQLIDWVFYLPDGRLAWAVREAGDDATATASSSRIDALDAEGDIVTTVLQLQGSPVPIVPAPTGEGLYYRSRSPDKLLFLPQPDGPVRVVAELTGPRSQPLRFAVGSDNETLYLGESGRLWKIDVASGTRESLVFRARIRLEVREPVRPPKAVFPMPGSFHPPRSVLSPRLSPDGRRLVFMAAGYLWEQSLDGGPARRLLRGSSFESAPAISPDGRLLAFVQTQGGMREIRLFEFESGRTTTLVSGNCEYYDDLSWKQNGKAMVFAVGEWPVNRVVNWNGVTGEHQTLVLNDSEAGLWWSHPHFSPENGWFYYTANVTGTSALYRQRILGRAWMKPEAVTELTRSLSDATVSPDGKWLAFRRNSEIWVGSLGSEPVRDEDVRRLASQGGYTFSFTPDSSAVIYAIGPRVWRQPLPDGEAEEIPIQLKLERRTPPPLLLRRVRLLDFGTGRFGPETSLLIDQERIRWIGLEQGRQHPEGTRIVDAGGRFAIPGLFDMHAHTQFGPDPERFLAYGVTSVRDAAGRYTRMNAFADRSDTSSDPYPRYFFSGDAFFAGYNRSDYSGLSIVNEEEARTAVHRLKASGVHFLKVVGISWALTRAVAEEARTLQLPISGHWNNGEGMTKAVTLGYASLEHADFWSERLYDDIFQMLAASGTRWVPTLTLAGGFYYHLLDGRRPDWWDEEVLVSIKEAHRHGVRLLAGSDMNPYGISLHWELENLNQAGLAPLEVLRIATQEAAVALNAADDLGALELGKLGDMVLLDANPLEDIRNTQAIWRVIKGGWVFNPEDL